MSGRIQPLLPQSLGGLRPPVSSGIPRCARRAGRVGQPATAAALPTQEKGLSAAHPSSSASPAPAAWLE
eukprot:14621832-Alexandrium_andersonii.AAC.1